MKEVTMVKVYQIEVMLSIFSSLFFQYSQAIRVS